MGEWMAHEQAEGRVPDGIAPEHLASLLMAVLDGLQLQQHLDEGAVDYDASLRALFRLM